MKRVTPAGLAAILACTSPGQVSAQSFGSTYTSTAPKDCRQIGKPSDLDGSTTRVCPGKAGLVVLIAEDDLREVVSVGRNRKIAAARKPAAQAWFHPFNSSRDHCGMARRRMQKAVRDHPALAHRRQQSIPTRMDVPTPRRCWS